MLKMVRHVSRSFLGLQNEHLFEFNLEGNFIWAKCRGKIIIHFYHGNIEFLSLSRKERYLTFSDLRGNIFAKISLREGWNYYNVKLPLHEVISFNVDEPIEKCYVNNDPRQLAFGIRELKKWGIRREYRSCNT